MCLELAAPVNTKDKRGGYLFYCCARMLRMKTDFLCPMVLKLGGCSGRAEVKALHSCTAGEVGWGAELTTLF